MTSGSASSIRWRVLFRATNRRGRVLTCALAVSLLGACPASSQVARDSSTDWLSSAGSESERYLRALQVVGRVRPMMWSIRPFSNRVLRRLAPHDTGHPWVAAFNVRSASGAWIRAIQPEVAGIFNTRFPYGSNDGPIWAGRGLTGSATVGLEGAIGPLEFRIAPQVFRAQNSAFPLAANGETGAQSFADARIPIGIDLPQRFGDGAYARLDPGQSSISLHLMGLALGASTANEYWGPASESPFLLGNNAAGFAHVFVGTDGPASIGPVLLQARMIAGRLEQSAFSVAPPDASRRSLAGIVVAIGARQIPGLEIGVARVFESVYPDSGQSLGTILRPLFEGILKKGRARAIGGQGTDAANQIASVFARWVFPASGVEVYGELGREDHSYDIRDLVAEPDHDMSYMLGLRRAWMRPSGDLFSLRGELLNTALTHLTQVRQQSPPYIHYPLVQGHTQLGQVLGAPGGYGGGSTTLAVDWTTRRGRRSIAWTRMAREPSAVESLGVRDLVHALSLDWLIFGARLDLSPEATLAYNFNRNLQGNATNLRFALKGAAHW